MGEGWVIYPAFRLGPVYRGKSAKQDFPGNPIVWTLAGTSPCGPTKHVGSGDKMLRGERPWAHNWYRTALFINCVHARNVVARWPNTQPKPLQPWLSPESGGTPWECGWSVIKKIRPLQTVPGERDLVWTQGLWFELFLFLTKGGLGLVWVSSRIYPSTLGSNFWEVEVGNGLSRPLRI